MNKDDFKKDFFEFLDKELKNVTLKEQLNFLNDISKWSREYDENSKKDFTYCSNCKNYLKTKYFKIEHDIHTTVETTYVDAGYGDDDLIGEVEYEYIYTICPKCGYKHVKDRYYRRTLWEKRRGE